MEKISFQLASVLDTTYKKCTTLREFMPVCQHIKEKLSKTLEFINLKNWCTLVKWTPPSLKDSRLTYILVYPPFFILFLISFLVWHQPLLCQFATFFKWLNTFLDKMVGDYLWNAAGKNSLSFWRVAEQFTLIIVLLSAGLSPLSSVQCQVRQSMQGPW